MRTQKVKTGTLCESPIKGLAIMIVPRTVAASTPSLNTSPGVHALNMLEALQLMPETAQD